MRVRQFFVMCTVALLPASACLGQTASDLLQEAAATLRETKAMQAGLVVRGEGAEMFRATLPSGTSKILLMQVAKEPSEDSDEAAEPEGIEWLLRLSGRGTSGSAQEPDPIDFDMIRTTAHDRWVDHKMRKVFEMPAARAVATRSSAYMASRLHVPTELLQSEPLKDELAASEVSLAAETVDVEGVKCHVVDVTYQATQPAPGRDARLNQRAKFYIGVDDQIIRRIDRISGSGAMSMTIVLEFSNVEAKVELKPEDFELKLPEGYELAAGSTGPTSTVRTNTASVRPANAESAPRAINARPVVVYPPAPAFAVKNIQGQDLTLESLRGSPSVLYFWGTWCMECREYNPLISDLAGQFADKGVRVIGLAARERDPSAATSVASLRGYAFELVSDGGAAARAFNVEVFPTIVVLNSEGGVIGTEQVRRGVTTSDVMSRVRAHLAKAIPAAATPDQDEVP